LFAVFAISNRNDRRGVCPEKVAGYIARVGLTRRELAGSTRLHGNFNLFLLVKKKEPEKARQF